MDKRTTVEEHDIYVLISKFLQGEAEAGDIESLEKWRDASPDNERMFRECRDAWELAHHSPAGASLPDKEAVWDKILSKIKQAAPVMYPRSFLLRVAGVAATIALAIGFFISFLLLPEKSPDRSEVTMRTLPGQKSEVALPDGSLVWLNGESSLTYYTDFQRNNREVRLSGEAFFDVAHTGGMFTVNSGGIQVQVHGTAFNVKAYRESDIQVSLQEGNVTVHTLESGRLLAHLTPGQKVSIDYHTQTPVVAPCDAGNENLWRHGTLKITDEPLAQLIEKMERWYGVNITFEGNSKEIRYWLTIKTESLTEILALINKTTPINYSINGEEVTIRYR